MTIIYFPGGCGYVSPAHSNTHTQPLPLLLGWSWRHRRTFQRDSRKNTHTHTNRGTLGLFPGGQNVNATHKDLSVPILMQSKTTQTDNRTLLGMSTERKNLFIVTFLKRQITSFLEKTQVCIWLIHHTVNFKLHFLIVNKKPEIKCDISAFVSSFVLC